MLTTQPKWWGCVMERLWVHSCIETWRLIGSSGWSASAMVASLLGLTRLPAPSSKNKTATSWEDGRSLFHSDSS